MTLGMKELFEMRLAGLPLPPVDERDSRRVYCTLCMDDGFVRVWHPKTVDAVRIIHREGKEWAISGFTYDCLVACTCRRGDAWHERGNRDKSYVFLPRYDAQKFCRIEVSVTNAGDRERLIQWIEDYRPPNFEPAFESWNQQSYEQTEFT